MHVFRAVGYHNVNIEIPSKWHFFFYSSPSRRYVPKVKVSWKSITKNWGLWCKFWGTYVLLSRVKWNSLWIFGDGIFHLAGVLSTRSYVMVMRTRLNLQRGSGKSVKLGIMKYNTHILRHKRMKAYQAFAFSHLLGGLGIHIFELDFSTPSLIL